MDVIKCQLMGTAGGGSQDFPRGARGCNRCNRILSRDICIEMKVAILGWGSLIWEPGADFEKSIKPWKYDGPKVKIEFSRISKSREGALTLVLDPKNGTETTVAWCISERARVEDALADLRCREGTTMANIGCVYVDEPAKPKSPDQEILAWAMERKLDAVIWTALTSNFEKERGMSFSVEAVTAYIKTLKPAGKVRAAEYV